jgi:hypothetical protein
MKNINHVILGDPTLGRTAMPYEHWRQNLFSNGYESAGFRLIEGKMVELLVHEVAE